MKKRKQKFINKFLALMLSLIIIFPAGLNVFSDTGETGGSFSELNAADDMAQKDSEGQGSSDIDLSVDIEEDFNNKTDNNIDDASDNVFKAENENTGNTSNNINTDNTETNAEKNGNTDVNSDACSDENSDACSDSDPNPDADFEDNIELNIDNTDNNASTSDLNVDLENIENSDLNEDQENIEDSDLNEERADDKSEYEIYSAFDSLSWDTERKAAVNNPAAPIVLRARSLSLSETGSDITVYVERYADYPNGLAGTDNYGVWRAVSGETVMVAACLNASLPGKSGTFTVKEVKNDALKACLLFMPGNAFYEEAKKAGKLSDIFGSASSEAQYMYVHIASSVIYSGDYGTSGASDPHWTSDDYTYINNLVAYFKRVASNGGFNGLKLSDHRLFTAYTGSSTQTIGWVEGVPEKPDLKITIHKRDEGGNPVKGAEFTVFGYSSTTGGYTTAVETKVSDENGLIEFKNLENSSDQPKTANGLFLVKETSLPEGYESRDSFINSSDKADFEAYGGRLYFVSASGGDCPAYRDTEAVTVMFDGEYLDNKTRVVYDHTGYLVSDKWDITYVSNVETTWWIYENRMNKKVTTYDDEQMSGGNKVWYRSTVSGDAYLTYSGDNYSVSSLYTQTTNSDIASRVLTKVSDMRLSGNYYGGDGVYDWSYTVPDGRVTFYIYNYRRSGYTYKFRVKNNTGSSLYIGVPIWTINGDQKDVQWISGDISAGQYVDFDAKAGRFYNLANLIADVYIGKAGGGLDSAKCIGSIYPIETNEYKASVFINEPTEGYCYIEKQSAVPDITRNNECYSLEGAVYGIYTDDECTDEVLTLETDSSGNTAVEKINAGTYYVKEISAPMGYKLDTEVHILNVDVSNTKESPALLQTKDIPEMLDASLQVNKIWDGKTTETLPSLAGAQFTVTFYGGHYNTLSEAENAVKNSGIVKRSWVLEIKKAGEEYSCFFSEDFKVSGDDFFKNNTRIVLPYGTIAIQETKAAPGYTLAGYLTDENGKTVSSSDNADIGAEYITRISKENGEIKISGGNVFTSYDEPCSGTIKIIKYNNDAASTLKGVKFTLTSSDGKEIYESITNDLGEAVFDDLYPDKYTLVEVQTVAGYSLLKDEIQIEIPMRMSSSDAISENLDITADGVIFVPESVDAEGNTIPEHYLLLNQTYEIKNAATFEMPASGASNTWLPGYVGIGTAASAVLMLIILRRKKNTI